MPVQKKRHIAKALTWRLLASTISFLIGWFVTGDIYAGLTFGVLDVIIKLFAYYFHERLWYRNKFGIVKNKDK